MSFYFVPIFCLFLAVNVITIRVIRTESNKLWETNYLLPSDTIPLSYDLILWPDLQAGNFKGFVEININITSPRDFLLNVQKTMFLFADGLSKEVALDTPIHYPPNEFWVIRTRDVLQVGRYIIFKIFNGELTREIVWL